MKRRAFITNATICIVGNNFLPSTLLPSLSRHGKQQIMEDKTIEPFSLDEATIDQLQDYMNSGKFSSEAIVQLYLNRIAEIDKKGPSLHAVIEINPDAIRLAKKSDEERKAVIEYLKTL